MDEAIEWVKRCPNPMEDESEIEIRPVFEAEDFGDEFTPEAREQECAPARSDRGAGVSKLIVSEFVSLNGIMEAPGGEPTHPHTGWTFKAHYGEDHYQYKQDEIEEAESLLLGRKTYEGFSAPGRSARARSPTRSTRCRSTWCPPRSPIPSGRTRP